MNHHSITVAVLWLVFTVAGVVLVQSYSPFPPAASEQAHVVDDAFKLLTILAVPMFALVVAVLLYSMVRFGQNRQPTEDGPPIRSHKWVVAIWLLLSTALTIVVIIHPGITGILELRADGENVDLIVEVEGRRFSWLAKYPEQGVQSRTELVLPIDETVQFEVMSHDVIHSLWIPAFRVKIDTVPGMTTRMKATPDLLGTYEQDVNLRIQCAELCGVGHAVMRMPVRVVERAEFDEWIAEQRPISARR